MWSTLGPTGQKKKLEKIKIAAEKLKKEIIAQESVEFQCRGHSASASSSEDVAPVALTAQSAQKHMKKHLFVELACHEYSKLGNEANKVGFKVLRLTKHDYNLSSPEGVKRAKNVISDYHSRGYFIDMWSSIPCTPWRKWNVYNAWRLGRKFKEKLLENQRESMTLVSLACLSSSLVLVVMSRSNGPPSTKGGKSICSSSTSTAVVISLT